MGLHFLGPSKLRDRLAGVRPRDLRRVVTTAFQQRRKTIRNSLKKLAGDGVSTEQLDAPPVPLPQIVLDAQGRGDAFALSQGLPEDWGSKRPEQLTPAQFVEITRLLYGDNNTDENGELGRKVWRKLKHGL